MGYGQTLARGQGSPSVVRAVLFDFDYTLADSSNGIIHCIDHALTGLGLPPAPPEVLASHQPLALIPDVGALSIYIADELRKFVQACIRGSD